MNFKDTQTAEIASWNIENEVERLEKAQRETVRYPMLAKQMGLTHLDTSKMTIFDIGAGPLRGVSSVIPAKKRIPIDPLTNEYSKYFNTQGYWNKKAEEVKEELQEADLIIITNALDHCEDPRVVLQNIRSFTKYSTYVAMYHAIDNAITHPHPAHKWNINPQLVHEILDPDFETVWELVYPEITYGWRKQPAHSILLRRTTE